MTRSIALAVLAVTLVACERSAVDPPSLVARSSSAAYELENPENPDKVIPATIHNTPISYIATIGNGVFSGSTPFRNINNPATWNYYSFCATAGAFVVIETHRTSSAMDPAQTIYFGTTNDSDGLFPNFSTQPGMTFISFTDDNNGRPHGHGGLFFDPKFAGTLPFSGVYTLAIYDFIGLGPNPTFETHVSGVNSNTPPSVSASADATSLWPPNHKYVPVAVSFSVSDPCDPAPSVSVTVASDEPDDANGNGDGATTGDVRVTTSGGELLSSNDAPAVTYNPADGQLELRAERGGGGAGRIYTITVTATNSFGVSASATATVTVPHDQ